MKCVKNKCGYCYAHDYQASYKICGLEGSSFHKDFDKECNIDKFIEGKYKYIGALKQMQAGILKLQ